MCCDKYAYFYHRDSIIEHAGTDLIELDPVLIWEQLEHGGGGGGDDDGRGRDWEHISVRDDRGQHARGIINEHAGTDNMELDPVLIWQQLEHGGGGGGQDGEHASLWAFMLARVFPHDRAQCMYDV